MVRQRRRRAGGIYYVLGTTVGVVVSAVLLAVGLGTPPGNGSLPQSATPSPQHAPRNIIIMVADGCGFNHVEAASLYRYGQPHRQLYERFPFKAAVSTFPAGGSYDADRAWSDLGYVQSGPTDSAAAATALACGAKTYNGAIGGIRSLRTGKFVAKESILERAEKLGKTTGVVTSVLFSHATPAGFAAHNESRSNYEQIAAEMLTQSAADVVMGAGSPSFDNDGKPAAEPQYQYVGGQELWQGLRAGTVGGDADGDGAADPWQLIETRDAFRALMTGRTPKRVCGVAQVRATLQQGRSGASKTERPFETPLLASVPTLAEMTRAALNVLDDDPDGLVLMVEGGAVDQAAHSNLSGRMIEEMIDFDLAVEVVADWVRRHSNWSDTLLIVTADHETGYLLGPGSGGASGKEPLWKPLQGNGRGRLPGMEWHSDGHTNSLVPIYAAGDASWALRRCANGQDRVRGPYLDNTEIARVIFAQMPLPPHKRTRAVGLRVHARSAVAVVGAVP